MHAPEAKNSPHHVPRPGSTNLACGCISPGLSSDLEKFSACTKKQASAAQVGEACASLPNQAGPGRRPGAHILFDKSWSSHTFENH